MMLRFLSFTSLLLLLCSAQLQAQNRPNVVLMLADDLGWGDISKNDGKVPTPNIDQLFKEGVELTQFMGWSVCSPTRAMLLTGRHPFRVGTGPEVGGELDLGETTIAEGFKSNGYRTGIFGKWHNGDDPDTPEFRKAFAEAYREMPNKKLKGGHGVNKHGFDDAWVYYGGGADFFNRRTVKGLGPVSWWHNLEFQPDDQGYTDDLVTERAVEFIESNRKTPFFCYIPFHLVHAPLQAKEEDLKVFDPKETATFPAAKSNVTAEDKHIHAAMVHALDKNVATILAALDKHGLRENTIVIFSSDNGAMEAGSSLPLRGAKHTIYEGGVRLPTVVHWPKANLKGGSQWKGLCGFLDLFPTLINMAGLEMPQTRSLDGKNIWPALRDRMPSPVESYYWVWRNEDSIRTDRWKMHRFYDRLELYDVHNDPSETTNVADSNSAITKQLTTKMDEWAKSLGAALSHQAPPQNLHTEPQTHGEVLSIEVTVTEKAKPKDILVVPFANYSGRSMATDWIEFDIAFESNHSKHQPFYSPFRGSEKKADLLFKRGIGIDQLGREQCLGAVSKHEKLTWEHRIVGLTANAPKPLNRHGIVFRSLPPGKYIVYLDNLRMRHADGSTTPIWSDTSHTAKRQINDSTAFQSVRVQTISADNVK